jgi:hypothetical protein
MARMPSNIANYAVRNGLVNEAPSENQNSSNQRSQVGAGVGHDKSMDSGGS